MTPELPRPIALIIAQAAIPTPTNGLNVLEIADTAATWDFPNTVPPLVVVAILMGGQPGTIYTTRWRLLDPAGATLAETHGADVPFTTQIRRVNLIQPLQALSSERIVEAPGRYTIELAVNGTTVGSTDIEIARAPGRPPLPPAVQ